MSETPPLTRGRQLCTQACDLDSGNTPAYAGKTELAPRHRGETRKHPRLRGEDHTSSMIRSARSETPPLTRGRPCLPETCPSLRRKHPRLRGEDFAHSRGTCPVMETPPLTRGRPQSRRSSEKAPETPPLTRGRLGIAIAAVAALGNTPAYAGKTRASRERDAHGPKHPRLRGEDARKGSALT